MTRSASVLAAAVAMSTVLLVQASARGQTAWYEGFEGPEPTWRDDGGDVAYRVQQHERLQGEAHTGRGCERISLTAEQGDYVHFSHVVDRPRVIDDLMPTVWIKSDRPGLQLLARVVLPRTEDRRTGRPLSTLVGGSSYTDVGRWQQLRIADIPRMLARQIRVLRAELGPTVDGREAYVESVVLNVYGGPGTTNVWIDDLDVAGFVAAAANVDVVSDTRGAIRPVAGSQPIAGSLPIDRGPALRSADGAPRRTAQVELVGSVLTAQGRPIFPRIILHQGEPLDVLRRMGFNAVWLPRPASPEILQQAQSLGLWLVCPPPRETSQYLPDEPSAALAEIGPEYDRVLAWDLGWGLNQQRLEATTRLAEQVRLADRGHVRPLVCLAEGDLRAYSRQVDLLLIDRRPLGTSLEMADYGTWIRRQPLLARPGTKVWTTVQTQPSAALQQQLATLWPGVAPPLAVDSEQIRLMAYTAVAAGSRGLLFLSDSPLTADDAPTRRRATALEMLNLELQWIEPWAAAGSVVATAEGTPPELLGTVLRIDRARLLLPVWLAPGAQYVPGHSTAGSISLIVPGVPESSSVYVHEIGPGGLRPLRHKRDTGGERVTLDEFDLIAPVLFTQDPLFVGELTRFSAQVGLRAAQLTRQLAIEKLQAVQLVGSPGGQLGAPGQLNEQIAGVQKNMQSCDGYLTARNYSAACLYSRRALRALGAIERQRWQAAVEGLGSPVASPGAVSLDTLPWHRSLVQRIAASRPGPNRLVGGDFETIDAMLAAGWRYYQNAPTGVQTGANLVNDAAHSGRAGVLLSVRAEDAQNAPAVFETPPAWLTSPPVAVEAGQLLRISGWVNVASAITGSVDGLMVVDSLTGPTLAQRVDRTAGWQPFTLYRAAPQSSQVTVTFVLSGLGEARIDDVTIETLDPMTNGEMTRRPPAGDFPR